MCASSSRAIGASAVVIAGQDGTARVRSAHHRPGGAGKAIVVLLPCQSVHSILCAAGDGAGSRPHSGSQALQHTLQQSIGLVCRL